MCICACGAHLNNDCRLLMKLSNCISLLTGLAILSASPTALAGYTCTGPVRGVAIDIGGDVLIESIGTVLWPRLCNVRAPANAVVPEACRTIYASLLSAQMSGRSVTIWVNDSATSCTSLPQWQYVTGFYFLRVDG